MGEHVLDPKATCENPMDTHRMYAMTPMDQQSTALLQGFWANTSGAENKKPNKHTLQDQTFESCQEVGLDSAP